LATTATTSAAAVSPKLLLNRELSWLAWNERVLALAADTSLPLLERARVCSFFSQNLDEFFMVRVAGLLELVEAGVPVTSPDAQTPQQTLTEIRERVLQLTGRQTKLWKRDLSEALEETGIIVGQIDDCTKQELDELAERFEREVFPLLAPFAVGPGQPFPYISGLSPSLGIFVRDPDSGEERFARVKVPELLPRFPSIGRRGLFLPLERVTRHFLGWLFPKMEIAAQAAKPNRLAALGMRRVGEFAELAGHEIGGLLADVHGVIADPFETAGDEDHPQPPLPLRLVAPEVEDALDRTAVGAVDQLVEVDKRGGRFEIAPLEGFERNADHLFRPLPHFLEGLDEPLVWLDVGDELGQLRDRDAVVAHPLEMQVRMQHRQHEPQVDGDRRLPREQRLDPFLDLEVAFVDLVVEGDHLVSELRVGRLDSVHRRPQRAQDKVALFLEGRLDLLELLLEGDPHLSHRTPGFSAETASRTGP
jgi:polyphosphate kinase-like protein